MHAEGVVHRGIKPADILLEATGTGRPHLRLSDFGISMREGEPRLTETDHVVGTPGHFAPEQLTGSEPDFSADLFAVGLVAPYLLQGSKPDSRALVEHFRTHGTPGAPEGVCAPLWGVIATLLRPEPPQPVQDGHGGAQGPHRGRPAAPAARAGGDPGGGVRPTRPPPRRFRPPGPAEHLARHPSGRPRGRVRPLGNREFPPAAPAGAAPGQERPAVVMGSTSMPSPYETLAPGPGLARAETYTLDRSCSRTSR